VPSAIYIADIRIALSVELKIKEKHGVTPEEVREALILRREAQARWEDHPVHGRRVVAVGWTYAQRMIIASLYPIDQHDGVWSLMTARGVTG
jgi:hypothetical protein